jgi:hypothetical protein
MTALLISPDLVMRRAILDGTKRVSIREGHRDYRPGDRLMICCHVESWAVMSDIESVRHTSVEYVRCEEYISAGYRTREEMFQGLRKFYPRICWGSPVTVIWWGAVTGKLVYGVKQQ